MIAHQTHQDRVDAGIGFDRDLLPPIVQSLADLSPTITELRFAREGNSYRGISRFRQLKTLRTSNIDASFLDEICELKNLESLVIGGVTATDLSSLAALKHLRQLIVNGASKITDLDWIIPLQALEIFAIENAKRVQSIEPIRNLKKLTALGIEGGMSTPMRIDSLRSISALSRLEWLFLTNLRVADKSLSALHNLSQLKALYCGRFFPREEFNKLERALPGLRCSWFGDGYDI